jgi:hypothetical protein
MADIRFTIVTNDADRALAESFGCARSNQPEWVRIITDPMEVDRIEDGTKVIGLFYSRRSAARWAFNDRRMLRGLVWLDDEDYGFVRDWVALHKRAAKERARRNPDIAEVPPIDPADSVIAPPAQPIQNLVLSQRWS